MLLFSSGGRLRHDVGFAAAEHPLAVHEHAAQALEGQRGDPRSGTCPRHPEQVQGEGEQDESDPHDHRRHHRLHLVLDPASG